MFLTGLGHRDAAPTFHADAHCWDALVASGLSSEAEPRSQAILRKVLRGNNGICSRYLAFRRPHRSVCDEPRRARRAVRAHAPGIAARAAERAIDAPSGSPARCGRDRDQHVHRLSLSRTDELRQRAARRCARDILALDLVGQGCGAALPNMRIGRGADRVGPRAASAVDLRGGLQRRHVPGRRSGRAHQRVPVRRRRRRRGPERRSRRLAATVEWKSAARC